MKTCTDYYYFVISFCVANCVLSVLNKENDDDDDDDDVISVSLWSELHYSMSS